MDTENPSHDCCVNELHKLIEDIINKLKFKSLLDCIIGLKSLANVY